MKKNYVPDGCFLLARQIFDSAIWRDDPHVLKLFIYLIGNARHNIKPKKYPAFEIKRGELVTSLAKISEENEYHQNGRVKKWARMKVSRMLDLLIEQGYIKKLCDTYGTHVSICNYDVYQEINNYKCDSAGTEVLRDCYADVTQVGINNNGKKGKKEVKNNIYGEFKNVSLSEVQYKKLKDKYGINCDSMIEKMSAYMTNKKGKPYTDHYAAIIQNDHWLNQKKQGGKDGKFNGLSEKDYSAGVKDF